MSPIVRFGTPVLLSLLLVTAGCGEAEVPEGEDVADELAVPPGVSLDPPRPATGGLELPGAQSADTAQTGADAASDTAGTPPADLDAAPATPPDSAPIP